MKFKNMSKKRRFPFLFNQKNTLNNISRIKDLISIRQRVVVLYIESL